MRIGVDIGGTKVIGALIDDHGHKHGCFQLQSKVFSTPQSLAKAVGRQIHQLLSGSGLHMDDITHMGVGIPGTADWQTGTVIYSPNLFGENIPLAAYLEEETGRRPIIIQDSWAGAYAEYLFGQNKQFSDMMCITLGTGIGCGIIQGGKVYSGMLHTAGEIGHVSIQMNGRPCSCGRNGCLETYASGTGIYQQALELFPEKLQNLPKKAESVFFLADEGDRQAKDLIRQSVEYLAFGLSTLINITACSNIFISGGLSCREEYMIQPLAQAIRRLGYPAWSNRFLPNVQRAALGSEAPLIGAAFLEPQFIL